MKNKRTKKTAVISCGLAALVALGGAFAFMSDHDNAVNKFNFTDDKGNQSIDIQLSETNWREEDGVDILYGTPVAKNPVATNIGNNDMYAFASVIVPAKAVTVQNSRGQLVNVEDTTYESLEAAGLTSKIVSNITTGDKTKLDDETEILGVFADETLETELAFGDEVPATMYFKLNAGAPYGVGYTEDNTVAGEQDTVAYKVLEDTLDVDNYTSNILGHQFMLKLIQDEDSDVKLDVRDLYTFEIANNGEAQRVISGAWTEHANAEGEIDGAADAAFSVFSRGEVNAYKAAVEAVEAAEGIDPVEGSPEVEGWIEITDNISDPTVYVDGTGRIYSAHIFYYSKPLAKNEATVPVFDYVELLNVTDAQVEEQDDMNIYVETYGVQVTGVGDAIRENATKTEEGVDIWDVMTNSENEFGFDIFGVVKDTND